MAVLNKIRKSNPHVQCANRQATYVEDRLRYEEILRTEFQKKGGRIERKAPHYMTVEHSPWLSTWFEHCEYIKIPIEDIVSLDKRNLMSIATKYVCKKEEK